MISGNMVGSYSQIGKTFIFVDEDGTELTGVVVDQETIFTAGDNDVRNGMVYASNDGVSTGTKQIPAYHTTEGYRAIPAGKDYKIIIPYRYDYTKLQAIICAFNTSPDNSVSAEKVCINDNVYDVGSVISVSTVTIEPSNNAINLGIKNEGSSSCVIRYFTYKEEV